MLALIPLLGPLLEKLVSYIPDPQEKARVLQQAQQELFQILQSSDTAQGQVNATEAASPSLFVAGWRPAAGWICVAGLFYASIGRPVASIWFPGLPAPSEELWVLLFGMLGLGSLRTLEKRAGIARN